MAKRPKRNQQVGVVLQVTTAVLLVGVAVFVWWYFRAPTKSPARQEFFSDDDGATWFADDERKIAPFDHNGKPAVLAKVYQTSSGKPFVAYLMKFTDKAHDDAVYSQKTGQMRGGASAAQAGDNNALLVKRPHDMEWVPANDPRGREIMTVKTPDGSAGYQVVLPE